VKLPQAPILNPPEFWAYNSEYAGQLEWIGWATWDHERYQGQPKVFFFDKLKDTLEESNMQVQGCFPPPNALMVRSIRLDGIRGKLAKGGVFSLHIGGTTPLTFPMDGYKGPRQNITLSRPLFIAPMYQFRVCLTWAKAPTFKRKQPRLGVALLGDIIRPVKEKRKRRRRAVR